MATFLDIAILSAINLVKHFGLWLIYIFALIGLLDTYCYIRFKRKGAGKIDQTASYGWWLLVKWLFASQTHLIANKLPFTRKDLSEALNVKEDDGKTT